MSVNQSYRVILRESGESLFPSLTRHHSVVPNEPIVDRRKTRAQAISSPTLHIDTSNNITSSQPSEICTAPRNSYELFLTNQKRELPELKNQRRVTEDLTNQLKEASEFTNQKRELSELTNQRKVSKNLANFRCISSELINQKSEFSELTSQRRLSELTNLRRVSLLLTNREGTSLDKPEISMKTSKSEGRLFNGLGSKIGVDISTQTEVKNCLDEYMSANNGENSREYNLRVLIAELNTEKELNRQLSFQLASVERDLHEIRIEKDIEKEKIDAKVASRIADALKEITENGVENTDEFGNDVVSNLDFAPNIRLDHEMQNTDTQTDLMSAHEYMGDSQVQLISHSNMSPETIAENSRLMMQYINEHGVNIRNEKDGEMSEIELSGSNKLSNGLAKNVGRMSQLESENSVLEPDYQFELLKMDHSANKTLLVEKTAEIDKLHADLKIADKDRKQWEILRKRLESQLPAEMQSLQNEKRELIVQLDREQNEKRELFLQMNSLIGQLAESRRELAAIYDEMDEKQRESLREDANCNQVQIEQHLDEFSECKTKFNTEGDQLMNEIVEMDREMQSDNLGVNSEFEKKLEQLQKEQDLIGNENQMLKIDLEEDKKSRNKLEVTVKSIMEKNERISIQNKYLKFANMQDNEIIVLIREEMKNLRCKNVEDEKELMERVEDKNFALKQMEESTKMESENKNLELAKLLSENAQLKTQGEVKEHDDKNLLLEAKLKSLEQTVQDLQSENGRKHSIEDMNAMKMALNALGNANAELEEEKCDLKVKLDRKTQELESAKGQLNDQEILLSDSESAKMKQLKSLDKVVQLEKDIAFLRQKHDDIESKEELKLQTMTNDNANLKRELIEEKLKLNQFGSENEMLKQKLVDVSREKELKLELESLKEINANLQQKLTSVDHELQVENEHYLERIALLQTKNDRIERSFDLDKMRHEQQQAKWEHDLYEMQQKLNDANEQVDALRDELKSVQNLESTHSVENIEVAKLKSDLERHQRLVIVLRRKLQHCQSAPKPTV